MADTDLIARARIWITNCVDPAEVGPEAKQQVLDALSATRSTPLAAWSTADLLQELLHRRVLWEDRRDRTTFTLTRYRTHWKAAPK